jgi:hypothetical protein
MGSNGKVQLCTNKQDPEAGMYDYAQAILGVNDGLWHHLVAVRNGDDMADAELYIDGVKIDLTPLRSSGGWSDSFSFRIGTRGSGSGNFIGHLDEIAIWNRSLTEQEAMQLFQAVVPEPGTFALLLGALFAGVLRRGRK